MWQRKYHQTVILAPTCCFGLNITNLTIFIENFTQVHYIIYMKNRAFRKLKPLGRRPDNNDRQLMQWALHECQIDEISGIGFKGLIQDGTICPRPYHVNSTINNGLRLGFRRKIPITLFSHIRMNNYVGFFYSDIRKHKLTINFDCDNKYLLSTSDFNKQRDILLGKLGLGSVYTQRSTNGNGTHSYFTLSLGNDIWIKNKNLVSVTDAAREIRRLILDFQKVVQKIIVKEDLKIHVDILGLPAVYDENIREQILRGSWVKFPFDMDKTAEKSAFENRQVITSLQLKNLVDILETECGIEFYQSASKLKVKPKLLSYGSTETKSNWDLVPKISKFFVFKFGSDKLPFRCRGYLSAAEFSDYAINIEHASRVAQCKKHEKDVWINTLPEKLVEAIYEKNRICKRNSQTNSFDQKKYRFIRECLVHLGLITVVDPRWFPTIRNDDGHTVREGIAAKWFVNDKFIQFFNTGLSDPIIITGSKPFAYLGSSFHLGWFHVQITTQNIIKSIVRNLDVSFFHDLIFNC